MATNVKRKKKKAEVMAEDGSMTLTGHLKELRNRLIICAVVFVVGVVVSLAYADRLIDLLTAMGREYYQFVSIAPQEKLMQYFRVSILAGVVVTVPVAFYHIYAFAKPGLKRSESAFFKLVMLLGLILFCVGVLFAYKLMMPFMLRFLSTGINGAEYIQTTTSIESYVNLCLTMFIIFGCVFEMPLVTIILAKMGIANPEIMKKGRGVAIVLIFLVAAIITPPDIVSQCFVAVPMCLLYFISIFLSGIFYKPKTDDDDEDEHEHHHEHHYDEHGVCSCGHHHHHDHDDDDHDEHRQHYQRIQRLLHHGHDHNIARHPYHIEEMPAPIGGTDFSSVNPVLVSLVGGREKVNSRLNPCADRLRVHRLRTDRASVVGEHHELLQAVIVFKQGGVQLFAVQQEIDSAVKTHVRHV